MTVELDLKKDIKSIFRAYDIRGVYNDSLTPEVIARTALAFGTFLNGKGKVTIAYDIRKSSEHIENIFVGALASTGVDVVRLGNIPIPLANFATAMGNYDAGIYITASHNPPEYNGIRFRNPDGSGYTYKNKEIADIFYKGDFRLASWDGLGVITNVPEKNTIEYYKSFIKDKIQIGHGMKLALDTGNGSASFVAPYLFSEMGCKVSAINAYADGSFPGRPSEPKHENIRDLEKFVKDKGADFGVAYDGDGDRCQFIDDLGRPVPIEKVGIIIAQHLKDNERPERNIMIANISCSMILEEQLDKVGIKVHRVRVGDVFVCEEIRKLNAIMGLESSAHFFIPKYYIFDDPLLTTAMLAEVLSEKGKKLSEISDSIPHYPYRELGYKVADEIKFQIVNKIRDRAIEQGLKTTTIDGIRVDYEDGWVLLRPSNTEPKIRMFVEAKTDNRLSQLISQYEDELREMGVNI